MMENKKNTELQKMMVRIRILEMVLLLESLSMECLMGHLMLAI